MRQVAVQLPWQNFIWDTEPRKLIHVTGHGGGRWYGTQLGQEVPARTHTPGFRTLQIDGTSTPLTLYQPNAEHARSASQFELDGASNIRILGIKTEATTVAWLKNASNILIAGHAGHDGIGAGEANWIFQDSTNIVAPVLALFPGTEQSPQGFNIAVTKKGSRFSGLAADVQCSLYKDGKFDASMFPRCGDGVCDGAETASNCRNDCR
jgi:hypothetical protein